MAESFEIVLPAAGSADYQTGSVFFVGTATVLLRYAGFTILTDPNFIHRHEKVRLGYGLSSRRLTEPALDIKDLPPIDLVVLSHLHEDHFDRLVARELDKALPIVTTKHAAASLGEMGFTAARALDTWGSGSFVKGNTRLRITATPGTHGPGVIGKLLPPVMGSVLQFEKDSEALFRVYITGDTLIFDRLREIPEREPDLDLALLHLGGTRAFGILVTMDGRQGVEMLRIVQPKRAIPIHYNDYTIFKSPLSDFQRAVEAARFSDRVIYLSHDETYQFEVPAGRVATKR
ncbi:MAG TPA: MBL fold metallo-hydrolase [Thermomicrobiales bacterium]|nr:MBL fold metallo-hydrolase [Thermomicrobiales bacterium]